MEFLKKLRELAKLADTRGYSLLEPKAEPKVDPLESDIAQLMSELGIMEVQAWVTSIVDWMVLNRGSERMMPDDTLDIFKSLSQEQQELAFLTVVGLMRVIIDPPQEDGAPLVTV